ncbi:AI-2E family transporter [bacterium]|nr:AI-2E family transporter [bacterium]
MNNAQNKYNTVFYILGLIVLLALVCWLLSAVHMIVNILVASILIAYLIAPAVHYLQKKGISASVAIGIVYLLLIALALVFVSYLWPVLQTEFSRFAQNFSNISANLHNMVQAWLFKVQSWLPKSMQHVVDPEKVNMHKMFIFVQKETPVLVNNSMVGVIRGMRSVVIILTGAIIVPLMVFYILMDTQVYKKSFISCLPKAWRKNGVDLLRRVDYVLGNFIRGQLIVCVVIGVCVAVALSLLGIDYAILIGLFTGVIDIIPYVGVAISYVPAFIIALLNKGLLFAIFTVLVLYVLHWIESHILVPAIVGKTLNLPPLTVMAALIAGAELGGIMGMLLAVPITAIIRVCLEFYTEKHPAYGPLTEEDIQPPDTPYPPAEISKVSPKESVKTIVDKVQQLKNNHLLRRKVTEKEGITIVQEIYAKDSAETAAVSDGGDKDNAPEAPSKDAENKSEKTAGSEKESQNEKANKDS